MAMQRVLTRLSPLLVLTDRKYIPSFNSTVVASPSHHVTEDTWTDLLSTTHLKALDASSLLTQHKRVVFFGEQHHQSQVLRAQMMMLNALHQASQSQSQEKKKLVLVLEHFNFEQDPLLRRFSRGQLTETELLTEYAKSKEGFNLVHYLPLLTLARELGVSIHGGFPPRPWASLVYKESVSALRNSTEYSIPTAFHASRWSQVTTISAQHVAYLNSMMSGRPPTLSSSMPEPGHYSSGILAAQALKDTFFAWSIDRQLEDPQVVVLAVCGLGHCEYGLSTPPRLRGCAQDEILIVASKDWESSEYKGDAPKYTDEHKLADLIIPYAADEPTMQ